MNGQPFPDLSWLFPKVEPYGCDDSWLPNDPLFTPDEWQQIKNHLCPLSCGAAFSELCDQLKVFVGHYRAAAMHERPEGITGFRHRSKENQRKLKKALTAVRKSRDLLIGGRRGSPLSTWHIRAKNVLSHKFMRMRISDNNANANDFVPVVLEWFTGSVPEIDKQRAFEVFDVMQEIILNDIEATTKPGRQESRARKFLLEKLVHVWVAAKGERPKLNTDRADGTITGEFLEFCYAIFRSQNSTHDDLDLVGLTDAIKKVVYPRKI